MRRGGVTAKQVHVSLDAQLWADKQTFFDSEHRLDGYLRRALTALDYIYWQVESSNGALTIALEPDDIVKAKAEGRTALMLGSEGNRILEAWGCVISSSVGASTRRSAHRSATCPGAGSRIGAAISCAR